MDNDTLERFYRLKEDLRWAEDWFDLDADQIIIGTAFELVASFWESNLPESD